MCVAGRLQELYEVLQRVRSIIVSWVVFEKNFIGVSFLNKKIVSGKATNEWFSMFLFNVFDFSENLTFQEDHDVSHFPLPECQLNARQLLYSQKWSGCMAATFLRY